MIDILVKDKETLFIEPLNDLGVGLIDIHSTPRATITDALANIEFAVIVNRHNNGDIEFHASVVVVDTMARSAMYNARTIFERYVVGIDKFTDFALVGKNRLLVLIASKICAGHRPFATVSATSKFVVPAKTLATFLNQITGDNGGATIDNNSYVFCRRVKNDTLVCRKRPWRSGPNGYIHLAFVRLKTSRSSRHFKADEDSGAYFVAVFNFSFSKCCVTMAAPMNGLAATIHTAVKVEFLENLNVTCFIFRQVGEVRIIPLSTHAKALEALALAVKLLSGVFATDLTERSRINLSHFLFAELLFNLVFNRQAMTIPARNIGCVEAAHRLVLNDEVFKDLIEGMTDMNRAICIRRTIVQDEGCIILVLFKHLCVNVDVIPILKALRFVFRQVRTHREVGARQIHGLLVAVGHDAPFLHPCICITMKLYRT